jgi:hypothetical protein
MRQQDTINCKYLRHSLANVLKMHSSALDQGPAAHNGVDVLWTETTVSHQTISWQCEGELYLCGNYTTCGEWELVSMKHSVSNNGYTPHSREKGLTSQDIQQSQCPLP